MKREYSRAEIADQLNALGVKEGGVLLFHTSFRAVRPVERGPSGLIEALLTAVGPDGTLTAPCWPACNDAPFDRERTPAAANLGVTAETLRSYPGAARSDHAFAFAALGPLAEEIIADPLPLPPHRKASPVGRVCDLDGQILLLGVDHDANTTLHLAEVMAGVPYRARKYLTVLEEGHPQRIAYGENDHCCQRFKLANEWLRSEGLQAEGQIGNARVKLFRSRDAVRIAIGKLSEDLLVFLHAAGAGCEECDEARASIPTS